MSIHEEDQENIWDTDQCAVDEVEKETIVNIPRVAKEFYNKLKDNKGKIKSKDYDEFVIEKPAQPNIIRKKERGLRIDCTKPKRFLNATADNSPYSALDVVKVKVQTPGYKEYMEYTIEKKRQLWSQSKDKPSHEIMKDFLN